MDKLRLLDHLIGTQDQQRATSRARLRLSEQLLRRLRLITLCLFLAAHLIELLLETLSGPADEGFDLRSEGRYIRCCGLLRIAGLARRAVQYRDRQSADCDEDDPAPSAALYAPLRVLLYENEAGHAVFEYDRPSSLFGQFGDERVTAVGRELDAKLERVLVKADS